ncbi:MAG: two-component system response regulator [Ponticaulis sp.]|nr:two-component system response regulator [Ponticaulis sp.]
MSYQKNVRILILDDNRQMATLFVVILKAFGFPHPVVSATVEEAQDICQDNTFDLILVDQLLKRGSGLEFVRWLRNPNTTPMQFVPIIMISSYSERSRIFDAIGAGVDEFLVKPVKPIDIARRIDAVTFKRRKFVRAENYFGPDRRRFKDKFYNGPFRRADDMVADEADVFEFD